MTTTTMTRRRDANVVRRAVTTMTMTTMTTMTTRDIIIFHSFISHSSPENKHDRDARMTICECLLTASVWVV